MATAERAVAVIIADIGDRRGIKHEWNAIDGDIQDEIRAVWARIILDADATGVAYGTDGEYGEYQAAQEAIRAVAGS